MECFFFVAVHEDLSEQENPFEKGVPGAELSNRSLKHCWVMQAASCNLTPISVAYIPMTRASPGGHIQQQSKQETLHAGSTASLRAGHRKPCGRGTGSQAKAWAWSAWTPHQAPCECSTHTLAPTIAASTATSTSMVGHMCCAWYSLLP